MIHYVYILFDYKGIPRYVGKGKNDRDKDHERGIKDNNKRKVTFINDTLLKLNEIPKVRIAVQTEIDAFKLEMILIKIIGRYPNGPLTNMTAGGNGFTSESMKEIWANRSTDERRVITRNGCLAAREALPEVRSERSRKGIKKLTEEQLEARNKLISASVKLTLASVPKEERSERARRREAAYPLLRHKRVKQGNLTPRKIPDSEISRKGWITRRINLMRKNNEETT